MPNFDIIAPNVGASPGLLMGLDPTYQAKQLANQQTQIQIGASQAFQNGLPVDPSGNTDWSAAYDKAMRVGAYDLANNLLSSGVRMSALHGGLNYDDPLGRGSPSGGGGPAAPNAFAPAAGSGDNGNSPGGGNAAPSPPADGSGQLAPMDVFAHAIGAQESGNKYDALGVVTKSGDRAYGRFQVMGANIPSWTKDALGQSMTPEQFLASPQAQDAVFKAKFGQSLQQYGNPADAASVWFSGRPLKQAGNAADDLGTTTPAYVQKFMAGLGSASQALRGGQGQAAAPSTGGQPGLQAGATVLSGSRAPLISFGGSDASAAAPIVAPTHAAAEPVRSVARAAASPSAVPDAAGSPTAEGAPVGDSAVMAARQRLAAAQDADPSSLTPAQQQQLTADTGTVSAYQTQRAQPQATATAGTAAPANVSDALARLQNRQGNAADAALWGSYQRGQGQGGQSAPLGVAGNGGGDPSSARAFLTQQAQPSSDGIPRPVSFGSSQDAPPGGVHPFGPGSTAITGSTGLSLRPPSAVGGQPPAPGGAMPPAGGVPGLAPPPTIGGQPPPGGGLLSGALAGAGSSAPLPISPNGGVLAAPPPAAGGMGQGPVAPRLAPMPTQPTVPPPEVAAALGRLQSKQGTSADSALWGSYQRDASQGGVAPGGAQGGAPATPASGPDLPNLPTKYQQPGGATRYVNDLLTRAQQLELGGVTPAAAGFQLRAKQVQDQLDTAQKLKNDLTLAAARANDRYNAMNSPDAIAAAGARTAAETGERNKLTLVPSVQPDGSTIMVRESDAVASANGGKPIVSAQPGYVTTGQGNLLTKLNDGSKAYQERQVASQRLDALSGLLENFQTGTNSTTFNEAVGDLRSLGIPVPNSATLNPGAMQEFTKNAYANVLSTMREQGNKQYQSEVAAAISSNPNPDLQPEANAAMIAQMKGIKSYYDENFRDYSGWYHGNKGAADDADFQTSWADKHPLGAYVNAAAKDIAPLGAPLPPKDQLADGQAYQVKGQKVRWSADSGSFVPFGASSSASPGRSSPSSSPPAAGARQASDGNWYVADPSRSGKYLMVTR